MVLSQVGTYKSVTGENPNKKSRLAQKETKKCDCESYFFIIGTLKRQRVYFFSAVFFLIKLLTTNRILATSSLGR